MPTLPNHRPTKNFFKMPNESVRRRTLSFGAKGLYGLLLSFPDGEEFSVAFIARYSNRGGYHIRNLLKELVAANLVEISTPQQSRATHSGGRYVAEKFRLSGGVISSVDRSKSDANNSAMDERESASISLPDVSQREPLSDDEKDAFADALAALGGEEY